MRHYKLCVDSSFVNWIIERNSALLLKQQQIRVRLRLPECTAARIRLVVSASHDSREARDVGRHVQAASMAELGSIKSLGALLFGISQKSFFDKQQVTEQLLKEELYPDMSQDEFTALYGKMKGILKCMASADMDQVQLEAFLMAQTRKQSGGGLSTDQAAVLSRFWKSQRSRVRESLLAQSFCEPGLRGLSWRVDVQTAARSGTAPHSGPVTLMELELGRAGQDSEFLCLEFDEAKVNQVLTKMADIQESIDRIVHRT